MLLSVLHARAQDSIRVTRISWAGGVCCSSGSDFTLNFPLKIEARNVDSMWIFIPGYPIHLSDQQLHTSNKNCTAAFGWSTNAQEESYYEKTVLNYYGITQKDVFSIICDLTTTKVILFFSNGKTRELPIKYTEEFLAYP